MTHTGTEASISKRLKTENKYTVCENNNVYRELGEKSSKTQLPHSKWWQDPGLSLFASQEQILLHSRQPLRGYTDERRQGSHRGSRALHTEESGPKLLVVQKFQIHFDVKTRKRFKCSN